MRIPWIAHGYKSIPRWMFLCALLTILPPVVLWLASRAIVIGSQLAAISQLRRETKHLGGSSETASAHTDDRIVPIALGLSLDNTQIGDADLTRLAGMPGFRNVREFSLVHTRITAAGLKALEGNQSIHSLDLSHTQVSDEGLKSIATMPSLTYLNLDDTQGSDAGIESLVARGNRLRIRTINLNNTKVTARGVESLAAAFSNRMLVIEHPTATHPSISRLP